MRKDKVKLVRLFRYLSIKDMKAAIFSGSAIEDDVGEHCGSSDPSTPFDEKPQQTKRVKLCYDFLSSIDQTGELLSVFDDDFFDEIKYHRNLVRHRFCVQFFLIFHSHSASKE